MFRNKCAVVIALMTSGMTGAYAADGTLHATGDVTESTCSVDVAGTTAQFGTIDIGNVQRSKVGVSNTSIIAKALGKDFYISFENCSPTEQYKLTLSGGNQNTDGTFNSSGLGNAQLTIIRKPEGQNPLIVDAQPLTIGPYEVGPDSRSMTMDVGLFRRYISSLTYGDLKYDVDYTVDFL